MSAAPVLKVVVQREQSDCAIAAIAMLIGESYEDVLRAVTVTDRKQGKDGLWQKTIIRIAKRMGHTLRVRTAIDWDSDYGILRLPAHCAVLRNGLVIETNGTIWDADAYLLNERVTPDDCALLVCDE